MTVVLELFETARPMVEDVRGVEGSQEGKTEEPRPR
jgi:hypothetical protein